MVNEVPDVSALILRILAHKIPIFLESTHGVAHCVSIFALYEWTLIVVLGILFATFVVVIHRAEDVGLAVLPGLFILHGACAVALLHPVVGFLEVRPVASFIAKTPHDYGRMVSE